MNKSNNLSENNVSEGVEMQYEPSESVPSRAKSKIETKDTVCNVSSKTKLIDMSTNVFTNSFTPLSNLPCSSAFSFQLILKTPYQGVAILPDGSYEFQGLLEQYSLKPNRKGKRALICAPNVMNDELKLIFQTAEPVTVTDICRSSLQTTIDRFTQIQNSWNRFRVSNNF